MKQVLLFMLLCLCSCAKENIIPIQEEETPRERRAKPKKVKLFTCFKANIYTDDNGSFMSGGMSTCSNESCTTPVYEFQTYEENGLYYFRYRLFNGDCVLRYQSLLDADEDDLVWYQEDCGIHGIQILESSSEFVDFAIVMNETNIACMRQHQINQVRLCNILWDCEV